MAPAKKSEMLHSGPSTYAVHKLLVMMRLLDEWSPVTPTEREPQFLFYDK